MHGQLNSALQSLWYSMIEQSFCLYESYQNHVVVTRKCDNDDHIECHFVTIVTTRYSYLAKIEKVSWNLFVGI